MWQEGDEREQALRTVPGDPYLLLVPLPEVTSGINAVWGGAGEGSRVQPGLSPGLARPLPGAGRPTQGVFPGVGAPSLEEKWGTSRAYTTKDSGRQVELRPGWLFQPWLGQGEVLPPGLPLEARCCPPDPLASCCPVPLRRCQSRNQFCSCPG